MIRINPCKVAVDYTKDDIEHKICSVLKCEKSDILSWELVKESLDARKKPQLFYSLIVDVEVRHEEKLLRRIHSRDVTAAAPETYCFPAAKGLHNTKKTVVAGAGPAGLVCAYYLAKNGFPVLLLERGRCVEERQRDVEAFWRTGILDTVSNVQFGEGGAGTFSDGKLNTLIKDKNGRCREILSLFVEMGAPRDILYKQKPHVGTDLLAGMVRNLRLAIEAYGGEVRFESKVADLEIADGAVTAVVLADGSRIACSRVALAIGHSARDTFEALHDRKVPMQAKAFAVGLRVQHSQDWIDRSQYGIQRQDIYDRLGSASYKLTAQTSLQRGVYSFCMCPGGYVVNASSETGRLCVNGMSCRARDSGVANSAVIVSVTPQDYGSAHPLAGVAYQRTLEERAYRLGGGRIPVQTLGAFSAGRLDEAADRSIEAGLLPIQMKGQYAFANLRGLLGEELDAAFLEGMEAFGRRIKGFDAPDTVLAGVEARTSSPVRILRDETGMSKIAGLYPCGEGAGYAGGITSAAMDGLYIAECIARSM